MSQLLGNIHSIIGAFNKYAKGDGECATLSKGELKDLIQKEFAEVIVSPQDPETIETMLQLLDKDCDGKVNFEEFTVLVFKVAKACYKKDHECGAAAAEGQSKRVGSSTRRQDPSGLSKGPTQQPAQELDDVSEPEPRCSCQEEEQESPKSETLPDRRSKEPLKQERGSRFSQKPSETCTAQRERGGGQREEKEPSCQGSRREVQHCSKPLQEEPQTVTEEVSRQSSQENVTPYECQTHGTQQSTVQKPSQPRQVEKWGRREPQKLEQEKPAQQPTSYRKDAPVESQGPNKVEQDAAKPKSQASQKAGQRPAQRGVQESQAPEQKPASQSCYDRQEEQPSLGCGKERTSMPERHSTRGQEPPRGEQSRQQQEGKPQTQGKGAVRRIVEEHWEAKEGSCQQPRREIREVEPAQSGKPEGRFLTRGKESTHQQERHSQGQEQVLTGQEEEESRSPECQSPVVTVRRQPNRDVQEPQCSGERHYCRHECQNLTPEQATSPQKDTKPWTSGKEACCGPTEGTKPTTTGRHEGQRLTRRQHETCPEESRPQNTGQSQSCSHEYSPSPQERTSSQKQESEEEEDAEKDTTARCECPSLRRRQRCPEESKPQTPGQNQHQEMSQTQERGASCEPPEAPEEATYGGQRSEQCQPCEEEQEPREPGQSRHRCQESQPLRQEQALSPKEETKPQISEREASCESVERQPPPSERCQSHSEERRPQKPKQSQDRCQGPRPQEQEQAHSPKEELPEREGSCESMEAPREATSVDHACQLSTSEQRQRCPGERDPQKPSKGLRECQSSESEWDIFPQEETKPCDQGQESSSQETRAPERASACHWEGQSSSARHPPQPEEGQPQNSGQVQYRPHECRPLAPEQAASPQEEAKPQAPQEREGSCEPTQNSASQVLRNTLARQPFRPSWPQQHRRVLQFPSPWSPKH